MAIKKTTILAAFVNALFLVITALGLGFEAVQHLFAQAPIETWLVIGIALLGVVVNTSTALLFRGHGHDLNQKGAYLHLIIDALVSLVVILVAIMIHYTAWYWLDPFIGLCIAGIILWSVRGFLRDTIEMLLDAMPHRIDKARVVQCLLQLSGARAIHDLHIWRISTQEIALTAHLVVTDTDISRLDYATMNQVLQQQFGIAHVTLQAESMQCTRGCESL